MSNAVRKARGAPAILAAVAEGVRPGGSAGLTLAALDEWLPECPASVETEAVARLSRCLEPLLEGARTFEVGSRVGRAFQTGFHMSEPRPAHEVQPPPPAEAADLHAAVDVVRFIRGGPTAAERETARETAAAVARLLGEEAPRDEADPPASAYAYRAATIVQWQAHWLAAVKAGVEIKHPLGPFVRAFLERPDTRTPFRPVKRASLAGMHRVGPREASLLPLYPGADAPKPIVGPLELPGIGSGPEVCPSWLLRAYAVSGALDARRGHGSAPRALRLFVGGMLHLATGDRDGRFHDLTFTAGEVIRWLHPGGWSNRRRDWQRLVEAFRSVNHRLSWVEVRREKGSPLAVQLMGVPVFPLQPDDDAPVVFRVLTPPSAAAGARINWPLLTAYGARSARLYRAYIGARAWIDRSASRGHGLTATVPAPLRDRDGRRRVRKGHVVRSRTQREPNPRLYLSPELDARGLARMMASDPDMKNEPRRAVETFEELHEDGAIELVRAGPGRWLVLEDGTPLEGQFERIA